MKNSDMKGEKFMKTAIVFFSAHHGNTRKLVEGAKNCYPEIDVFDVVKEKPNLEEYDVIGIASGIYASSFGKPLLKFLNEKLPVGKKVFVVHTSGVNMKSYSKTAVNIAKDKNCEIIGEYSCKGFNTFGPFKLIGGTGKGRPSEKDIKAFCEFLKNKIV